MNRCKYSQAEADIKQEPWDKEGSPWRSVFTKLRILSPHIWPGRDTWLQARLVFCVLLVLLQRVFNVFVPRLQKDIIDSLATGDGSFPYDLILTYTAIKMFQGGGGSGRGLVHCLKSILWIKIEQNTSRSLKLGLFNHIHSLGVRWHQARRTGEVLRLTDRGSSSVTTIVMK